MSSSSAGLVLQWLKAGRLEEAASLCKRELDQNPADFTLLMLMASLSQRLGDRQGAIGHLETAAGAAGNSEQRLKALQSLQRIGAYHEALSQLTGESDSNEGLAVLAASLRWQLGQASEALEQFRSNADRWPGGVEHRVRLIRALVRMARTVQAENEIQRALALDPVNGELHRLNAVCRLEAGEKTEALECLEAQSSNLAGTSAALHLLRALRVLHNRQSLDAPGAEFQDEQELAGWEGFCWAFRTAPALRWFGSSSALLQWAARQANESGVIAECGVYHGFSTRLLVEASSLPLHGFDSFQGLPEAWSDAEPAGSYSTGGRVPDIPGPVTFHQGWFEDTLPPFVESADSTVSLLHIDCDLYSSTQTALSQLEPLIQPGCLMVFDDFLGYPGFREHEYRAANEFFSQSTFEFELVAAVMLGRAVAFRVKEPLAPSTVWSPG